VAAELRRLCLSCGLCCDGSLFGRVPLEAREIEPARKARLRLVDGGFEQPCEALVTVGARAGARRSCRVYRDRPAACSRFVCRLYDRHRREGGPLEPRLAAVRRARELLAAVSARDPVGLAEVSELLERDFARA